MPSCDADNIPKLRSQDGIRGQDIHVCVADALNLRADAICARMPTCDRKNQVCARDGIRDADALSAIAV
jgi:hypothetical protein